MIFLFHMMDIFGYFLGHEEIPIFSRHADTFLDFLGRCLENYSLVVWLFEVQMVLFRTTGRSSERIHLYI